MVNILYNSFPSGHAASTFTAMLFVSLYLAGKLRIFNSRQQGTFARLILVLAPLSIAFFVAISRTMDYHHHFSDIIAGSVIGVACAICGYFLHYPSLFSHLSQFPKSRLQQSILEKKKKHDFVDHDDDDIFSEPTTTASTTPNATPSDLHEPLQQNRSDIV